MAPAGIEPATFQFVAQHLNYCATAVPSIYVVIITYDGGNVKSEADHNIFCMREFLILYIKRNGVKCAGCNLSFWSEREWYR